MKRRRGLLAACIVALLAVAFWLAQGLLAARLRTEYAVWTRVAWSHGWIATADRIDTGGFPFEATLTLHGFVLHGGRSAVPGGTLWAADRVTLRVGLGAPTRLIVEPQGRELVQLSNLPPLAFTADRIVAWIPLGRVRPGELRELAFEATDASGGVAGSAHPNDVRIGRLTMRLTLSTQPSGQSQARLVGEAQAVELPDTGRWPLGATVGSLAATLSLASPRLPGGAPQQAAIAWRDGGGHIDIAQLATKWGPLAMTVQGTVALDGALQPQGAGRVQVQGWAETLDALSRGGALPDGVAATAKAVVGLMAQPAPDGKGVIVPVSVRRDTLSLAGIPVVKLHPIRWGGN